MFVFLGEIRPSMDQEDRDLEGRELDRCYVCLEEEGEMRKCASCKGVVHQACWEEMVQKTGKEECGVCRRRTGGEDSRKQSFLLTCTRFCSFIQAILFVTGVLLYVFPSQERRRSDVLLVFLSLCFCFGTFVLLGSILDVNGRGFTYLLLA